VLFIEGGRPENKYDEGGAEVLYGFFIIAGILAYLLEYFAAQPKCNNCGKRTGMIKIDESNFSSYDYIGTKTYSITSKTGEKIGAYEGPVSRTAYNFTGHYMCKYCGGNTARSESSHYDK
jgi:hypothetical protein